MKVINNLLKLLPKEEICLLRGIDSDEFGPMMASIVTVTIPLIVAFIVAQKRFVEGITMTGMK